MAKLMIIILDYYYLSNKKMSIPKSSTYSKTLVKDQNKWIRKIYHYQVCSKIFQKSLNNYQKSYQKIKSMTSISAKSLKTKLNASFLKS